MNADPWVMNARVVSVHFDSIIELMDYDIRQIRGIGSGCIEKFEQLVGRVGAGEAGIGWLARTNKTHKDVIEHASIGDPELYDLVKQMSAAIDRETGKSTVAYMQEVHRPKRKLRFGDFGDELDIHKIYQGHSDAAWARRVRHPVMEKMSLVTLYVDIGGNSRMIADESLWRAAVAVKLADDYSAAGKSVKIIVGSTASGALAAILARLHCVGDQFKPLRNGCPGVRVGPNGGGDQAQVFRWRWFCRCVVHESMSFWWLRLRMSASVATSTGSALKIGCL